MNSKVRSLEQNELHLDLHDPGGAALTERESRLGFGVRPAELDELAPQFVSCLTSGVHEGELFDQGLNAFGHIEFGASAATLDDHSIVFEFDRQSRGPMEDRAFTFLHRPFVGDGEGVRGG